MLSMRTGRWVGTLAGAALVFSGCALRVPVEEAAPAAGTPASPGASSLAVDGSAAPVGAASDQGVAGTVPAVAAGGPTAGTSGAAVGSGAPTSGSSGAANPKSPSGRGSGVASPAPGPPAAPQPGASSSKPAGAASPTPKSVAKLGSVGTYSGPVGEAGTADGIKAVQAWAAAVNDRGGLNGHPVKLFVIDDGGDPARNRSATQSLVESEGVIAFVYAGSPLAGSASVSYLEQKKVPVIGTEGGSPWANQSPMFFPQLPTDRVAGVSLASGVAGYALPKGKSKLALVYCAEFQSCANMFDSKTFEQRGLKVVYQASASIAQPDYTAQCLGARNAGAEVLAVALDPASGARLADACSNIGYKPLFSTPAFIAKDHFLRTASMEGMILPSTTAPFFFTGNPAVAEFHAVMARYLPGKSIYGSSTIGWAAAKLAELAGAQLPEPPTSAALLEGLWSVKGNDLGGLTIPLQFDKGAPNNAVHQQACWWNVVIQSGKYATPDGGVRHCA